MLEQSRLPSTITKPVPSLGGLPTTEEMTGRYSDYDRPPMVSFDPSMDRKVPMLGSDLSVAARAESMINPRASGAPASTQRRGRANPFPPVDNETEMQYGIGPHHGMSPESVMEEINGSQTVRVPFSNQPTPALQHGSILGRTYP